MKKIFFSFFVYTLFIEIVWAQPSLADSRETIDVADITPGMKGYGLTVFSGTEPERFDVEVIGVLHNFRPDQDLILIRTPHPVLNQAFSVRGMSGSPVYLGGKLAGAYAYGWSFGKEPVAGVTPIRNMLNELERPLRPNADADARAATPSLASAEHFTGKDRVTAFSALLSAPQQSNGHAESIDGLSARDVATPLLVSGLSSNSLAIMSKYLEPLGLLPIAAGGGGARSSKDRRTPSKLSPQPFAPGSAIGVQLARGDVNITSAGTVTYVSKNRVLAFGHPMMNAGETSLPVATARVVHIMSNMSHSFKMAEAVSPAGTLIQDRQSAVLADTNRPATTIPLRVHLTGLPNGARTEWNVELASHRMVTPMLIFAVLHNALEASVSDQTDMMFEAHSAVTIKGLATYNTSDLGYAPSGISEPWELSKLRLFAMLDAIYNNPFTRAEPTRVDISLRVHFARNVSTIIDAGTFSDEVEPGKELPIDVSLRPYGGAEIRRIVHVRIPENMAGQDMEISIESGDDAVVPSAEPRSLDDILKIIQRGYRSDSLVATIQTPARGLRFRGRLIESLPSSVIENLQTVGAMDRAQPFTILSRVELPIGQLVRGGARVKVHVRDSEK